MTSIKKQLFIIFIAWNLIFAGLGLIFSESKLAGTTLLFFIFCFLLLLVPGKQNDYALNPHNKIKNVHLIINFYILFVLFKFIKFGIPIFSPEANFERVYFMNHYKLVSDVLLYCSYMSISYFSLKGQRKRTIYYSIILLIIGLFSGFRSIMVYPVLLILFVNIIENKFHLFQLFKLKYIAPTLMIIIFMVTLTFIRFDGDSFFLAIELLFHRIFFLNVENVNRIIEMYDQFPHPNPFTLDFFSVFSHKPGFSGYVTKYYNDFTYDIVQLTPTIFGEAYAMFGKGFFGFYPLIFYFFFSILMFIYKTKKKFDVSIKVLIIVTYLLFIVNLNQGIGTITFIIIPKLIISFIIFSSITLLRFKS